ncbi:MAG: hypothetical protein ACRC10_00525, partial [Thermoguttaceae bacterium]
MPIVWAGIPVFFTKSDRTFMFAENKCFLAVLMLLKCKRSRNLITGEGTSRSGAIKNHCETAGTNVGGLPPNKWADTLSCK